MRTPHRTFWIDINGNFYVCKLNDAIALILLTAACRGRDRTKSAIALLPATAHLDGGGTTWQVPQWRIAKIVMVSAEAPNFEALVSLAKIGWDKLCKYLLQR